MKTLYTAHATTIGGRDGATKSDDGTLDLKLSTPGGNKPGTNPEQLFAAGYSACFGSAIGAVVKMEKISPAPSEIKVTADVGLNQDDNNGYFINVILNVTLAGVDDAKAKELVEKAHQVCPYSKATRGNVDVQLKVNNQPLAKAA